MSGVTMLGRFRSAAAFVIVSGLLAALFTVCCCLTGEQTSLEVGPAADIAWSSSADEIATDGHTDGHAEPGCDRAAETAAAVPAVLHGAKALTATAARGRTQPVVRGTVSAEMATPQSPAAHLLCVMRT